jgi:hypothetical protein
MAAGRIGASDAGHAESIVATGQESLTDVANPVQPEHPVRARESLVVDVAELREVALEDRV